MPFGLNGQFSIEIIRDKEPEDRVAQKFQPFVVLVYDVAVLIEKGAMDKSELQKIFIKESVLDSFLDMWCKA